MSAHLSYIKFQLRLVCVPTIVLIVSGCERGPSGTVRHHTAPTQAVASDLHDGDGKKTEQSPGRLAAMIVRTYQNMQELEFVAHVKTSDRDISCRIHSYSDGRHRLEVRESDGTLIYEMDQCPIEPNQIRFREHCLRVNKRADYTLSNTQFAYEFEAGRKWDPKLTRVEHLGFDGCLFGGYLRSWIGPSAHQPEFWKGLVKAGKVKSIQILDSSHCYVVATERPQRPTEEIWIDRDSGLVRRWRDSWRDRVFLYGNHFMQNANREGVH